MDHCEALIGALVDCETRLNYYSTNHIPESLGLLLRTAALDVHTVIKELQSLQSRGIGQNQAFSAANT